MVKDCNNCERFNKHKSQCDVLKVQVKDCWAWTDDKDWNIKVAKAVREYREMKNANR